MKPAIDGDSFSELNGRRGPLTVDERPRLAVQVAAYERQSFRKQLPHGFLSRNRILSSNRIEHTIVQRQEDGEALARDLMADVETDGNEISHLEEKGVPTGSENGLVKPQVRLSARHALPACLGHISERLSNFRKSVRRSPVGGQRRCLGLDHQPDFEQLIIELCRGHRAVAPAQNLRIQQVPLRRWQDANAGTRAAFEQAARGKRFDGFANDGTTGAELSPEIGFTWEGIVESDVAPDNPRAEFLDDMRKQIALALSQSKSRYRLLVHRVMSFAAGDKEKEASLTSTRHFIR